MIGPNPASSQVTTIGGMVSVDAAGSRWPRYGSIRRHVKSMRVVLADGEMLHLGRHEVAPRNEFRESARVRSLVHSVDGLLSRHDQTISAHQPKSLVNCSGYQLDDVRDGPVLDLGKLIVGSEGTLTLVTEVTLATVLIPSHRGCVLLVFESLDNAARAAIELQPLAPSACDLMDRRHLTLARDSDPRYEFLIPPDAEALLLVEMQAESAGDLEHRINESVELLQYKTGLAAGSMVAQDAADNELFWQLATRFMPTLYQLTGSSRPIPCVEDIAVPPAALPVFLKHVQDVLKRRQVTASLFGHVGHGQLHIRPFLDLARADDIRRMEAVASELYEKVWLLGGTISGGHGDGLSRTPFLARQYGPLLNVFRELKRLFDPQTTLNPGKIVPTSGFRMTQNLRRVTPVQGGAVGARDEAKSEGNGQLPRSTPIELQLNWRPEEMTLEARQCNGCGICRTHSSPERMCPIFRAAPREEASPRAKANLMRGLLTGAVPPEEILLEVCKQVSDLCVHCHMCRLECPAGVDIPKLMLEAKSTYVRTNGLPWTDWLLSRIDTLSWLGGKFPAVANWALSNTSARWVLERTTGIARGRKLPRLARRSFLRWSAMRRLHRPARSAADKVLYFVDTYANYYDTRLAEALVTVMRHNGIAMYVPLEQRDSAMPMISQGALEPARRIAMHNVMLLADAVRRGYTIVATEPSAVLALTHEYPIILDQDEDALLVAEHTHEASHYLWQRHQEGRLKLDFDPLKISVGYHLPCHQRALGFGSPAENLLHLVPKLRVNRLEKGCSGMAGTYGLKRQNYRSSLRAGSRLISAMRDGSFRIGASECSTCKMQMEQATTKSTVHPIKLIALAYGQMPAIRQELEGRGRPLVVT
jgi:Fe-S oxidoreductase/FAD/FMN-containing dehydrogenase